jgi:hypothetical protein
LRATRPQITPSPIILSSSHFFHLSNITSFSVHPPIAARIPFFLLDSVTADLVAVYQTRGKTQSKTTLEPLSRKLWRPSLTTFVSFILYKEREGKQQLDDTLRVLLE